MFCRVKPADLAAVHRGPASGDVSRCVRTANSGPFILPSTVGSEVSFQAYPSLPTNVVELARRNVTNPQQFVFDGVLDEGCSQKACFDMIARPLLSSLVAGYNAAIIAYGQTGSGKTYTILGPEDQLQPRRSRSRSSRGGRGSGPLDGGFASSRAAGNELDDDSDDGGGDDDNARLVYEGLLPRVLGEIIDLDNQRSSYGDAGFGHSALPPEWACSSFEIYCNSIYDLLAFDRQELAAAAASSSASSSSSSSSSSSPSLFAGAVASGFRQLPLHIREDPTLGPFVEGLREVAVQSAAAALELVRLSMAARATGETCVRLLVCFLPLSALCFHFCAFLRARARARVCVCCTIGLQGGAGGAERGDFRVSMNIVCFSLRFFLSSSAGHAGLLAKFARERSRRMGVVVGDADDDHNVTIHEDRE